MSTYTAGTFVRFYIASETAGDPTNVYVVKKVVHRDPRRIVVPLIAYAFQFFDVEVTFYTRTADSECKEVNASPKYFVAGRMMTFEEVQWEFPSEQALLFNLKSRGCSTVIMTKSGDFYPFDSSTCVLLHRD